MLAEQCGKACKAKTIDGIEGTIDNALSGFPDTGTHKVEYFFIVCANHTANDKHEENLGKAPSFGENELLVSQSTSCHGVKSTKG